LCFPLDPKPWIDAMSQPESFWTGYIERGFERVREYQAETRQKYLVIKDLLQIS
ncbi:MAG: hypothetical protein JWQ35_1042, partial [Bacteriovoracaceae bacterium]|nr:hypothetical protein [Bacteriovoracaceae bacterium]